MGKFGGKSEMYGSVDAAPALVKLNTPLRISVTKPTKESPCGVTMNSTTSLGVYVHKLEPGLPFAQAGIELNDRILMIHKEAVTSAARSRQVSRSPGRPLHYHRRLAHAASAARATALTKPTVTTIWWPRSISISPLPSSRIITRR